MTIDENRPPPPAFAGGDAGATAVDPFRSAAPAARPAAVNGGTHPDRAVEMARMLSGIVQDLVRQLEEQEAQGKALREKVGALEDHLRSHESLRQTLRQLAPTSVTAEELQNMQRSLQALSQDPNHIMVLASVAQQARQLLDVVAAYARVHDALR